MIGNALRESRAMYGLTQKELGEKFYLSGSMINEEEHNRKKLPKDHKPKVAREMNDGALYLAIGREATGGPMVSPYLNNVDNHRLVAVLKFQEEVVEALDALKDILPILLRATGPEVLRSGEKGELEEAMLEMIESVTAAQNTLARMAKVYGISLADLWDKHEAELVQKGYLVK